MQAWTSTLSLCWAFHTFSGPIVGLGWHSCWPTLLYSYIEWFYSMDYFLLTITQRRIFCLETSNEVSFLIASFNSTLESPFYSSVTISFDYIVTLLADWFSFWWFYQFYFSRCFLITDVPVMPKSFPLKSIPWLCDH